MLSVMILACTAFVAEVREWRDTTGRFAVRAELIEFNGTTAKLKKTDGRTIEVPVERLSDEDRDFLKSWDVTRKASAQTSEKHDAEKDRGEEAWIGVSVVPLETENKKRAMAYPTEDGVIVSTVTPNGPAEHAGIRSLDIITKVAGKPVAGISAFEEALRRMSPGESYQIELYHREAPPYPHDKPGNIVWHEATVSVIPVKRQAFEKQLAEACPLELVSVGLKRNIIGVPEVTVTVKNVAKKDVVAYTLDVECRDRFDEPVAGFGWLRDNVFGCISQDTVRPAATDRGTWMLSGHDNTTHVKVAITRVKVADGTEWRIKEGNEASLSAEMKQ